MIGRLNKKNVLAAALAGLFLGAYPLKAERLKLVSVNGGLTDISVTSAWAVPVPPSAPPAATEAARTDQKAAAAAPAPGKAFNPVVYDEVRSGLMMRLISDIYNGKKLPYSQDGATFQNKEGLLPAMPSGYYKEYTLITGDAPDTVKIGETVYQVSPDLGKRGAERIVIGGGEKIYYSPDHYKTFVRLDIAR